MYRCTLLMAATLLICVMPPAFADITSGGEEGIDAFGIGLAGAGVAVGMVEEQRPAIPGFDAVNLSNATVTPHAVYLVDGAVTMDQNIDSHAISVAGVLLAQGPMTLGIATEADIYASAIQPGFMKEFNLAAQHVATQNMGEVPVINVSYGLLPTVSGTVNGMSLSSLFVDWSSRVHETLYVTAGDQFGVTVGKTVPMDSYNGITVAASAQIDDDDDYFREVDSLNSIRVDPDGLRTFVDILAPGRDILTPIQNDQNQLSSGTSYAAPHVTGTVALLQEYANQRIPNSTPRWDADARLPTVMKAVLMNSADKLKDTSGDGALLGMTRDVLKTNGDTWLDSMAFINPSIPLDEEMGTGHLNARRALTQFQSGEHDANEATIPNIGWDYGNTDDDGLLSTTKYRFAQPFTAGDYVSITLTWDRQVVLDMDRGTTGAYDAVDPMDPLYGGDTFEVVEDATTDGFNNLNLYLLPAGAGDLNDAIAFSFGSQNVEHLFFQIPTTQVYEFWVDQFFDDIAPTTDYAVAWWYGAPPEPPGVSGDFDGSGTVDADDYTLWKDTFGDSVAPGMGADGNGDGIVNLADYTVWRDNLGATSALSAQSVPEPSSLLLCLLLAVAWYTFRLSRLTVRLAPSVCSCS